eukprot:TRINITY_DN12105_c0_g1_i1.p1 TRINITY_DN12105_c0_g1~~TRINITY_DN12105_c0_g1_i1.p1  ORF type:complete len:460 (+),score=108.21 TRINITY_DN12105_c0_g1_i1:38-1381(+)
MQYFYDHLDPTQYGTGDLNMIRLLTSEKFNTSSTLGQYILKEPNGLLALGYNLIESSHYIEYFEIILDNIDSQDFEFNIISTDIDPYTLDDVNGLQFNKSNVHNGVISVSKTCLKRHFTEAISFNNSLENGQTLGIGITKDGYFFIIRNNELLHNRPFLKAPNQHRSNFYQHANLANDSDFTGPNNNFIFLQFLKPCTITVKLSQFTQTEFSPFSLKNVLNKINEISNYSNSSTLQHNIIIHLLLKRHFGTVQRIMNNESFIPTDFPINLKHVNFLIQLNDLWYKDFDLAISLLKTNDILPELKETSIHSFDYHLDCLLCILKLISNDTLSTEDKIMAISKIQKINTDKCAEKFILANLDEVLKVLANNSAPENLNLMIENTLEYFFHLFFSDVLKATESPIKRIMKHHIISHALMMITRQDDNIGAMKSPMIWPNYSTLFDFDIEN